VEAGRVLAASLGGYGDGCVVLGLPRGGVIVAAEVAAALNAPLDAVIVRKLGAPGHGELAIGAVGEGGVRVVDEGLARALMVTERELDEITARETAEVQRRVDRYRAQVEAVPLEGTTAIIVDDGVATGSTALAACKVVRSHRPLRLVLAVPVAPPDWLERFGDAADEYVCPRTPEPFYAVGQWYDSFPQVEDQQVIEALQRSRRRE
jgi:predicted phosphoribosyltransferase